MTAHSKARIRRRRTPDGGLAEGWVAVRPPYGFRPTSEVTTYASWEQARDSFNFDTGSAAASSERAPAASPGWLPVRGDTRLGEQNAGRHKQ